MKMDYQKLCPIGLNVRIIAPIGSGHEGWTVMPVTRKREEMFIPEGYELVPGVGNVTGYGIDNVAKKVIPETGVLPIENLVMVEHYIQCHLNVEWWNKELTDGQS